VRARIELARGKEAAHDMTHRLHNTRADARARMARIAMPARPRIRTLRTPASACALVARNFGGMRAPDRCRVDRDD
jgi:hypothetical protein